MFLIPIFGYCHVFFSFRTFIPVTKRNIRKYFPWFFHGNFNKTEIRAFYNFKIIDRLNILICTNNIILPFCIAVFFLYLFHSFMQDRSSIV